MVADHRVLGYFGLTAKKTTVFVQNTTNISPKKLCTRSLGLTGKQKRMCQREPDISKVLLSAAKASARSCAKQFEDNRWNCPLGKYRLKMLEHGLRETAFLYAISSAGLVHSFARACSLGLLSRCTCDKRSVKHWKYGGCGDNIRFGMRFTKRLLRKARKPAKDFRAKVNMHNTVVGMKMVNRMMKKNCRCHGPSGSCTMKTCWRQVADLHLVAKELKGKYDKARKVMSNANTNKVRRKAQMYIVPDNEMDNSAASNQYDPNKPTEDDLVFLDQSPNFCSHSEYSEGTMGRNCNKTSNCAVLCCDRGYNTQLVSYETKCYCKMKWCCKVTCQRCRLTKEIHLCK
ncbi:protein Wnt-9a-like [Tubulanus polymorphus]|uniref:protein Wnt-9a-like n=1 Tax=Tubulanus polymorphus TaxID=672921 RepID=UPI003DA3AC58